MTRPNPFVRVVPGGGITMLHVAKARFPNESICGRRLQEAKVSGRNTDRPKCLHCVQILKAARANNGV